MTSPSENRSARAVDAGAARLLGRHEAHVPFHHPVLRLGHPPLGLDDAEVEQLHLAARGKRMLLGETSRWTIPIGRPLSLSFECAYSSASSVSAAT